MKVSRRFVLRGLGASLALPVLPSLLSPREARAQAQSNKKCFALYATNHGGIWAQNMFPSAPTGGAGLETMSVAGRSIRRFPLLAQKSGGTASLSPTLSAPDTRLSDGLLAKMFSIQGLDIPFYISHNTGGHLGNFSRNDGNGTDGQLAQTAAIRRTIDQIMAWSPAFYTDLGAVRQRTMLVSGRMSYNYANPDARTGDIQEITAATTRPDALFDSLFPQTGTMPRAPIVDRVLEGYQRLRASSRISAADKIRLDDHLQRVHELQRRLGAGRASCSAVRPTGPTSSLSMGEVIYNPPWATDPASQAAYFQQLNDVFVVAMSCGISRIAVARVDPIFSTFTGDWHQDVAHQADQADGLKQAILYQSHQRIFADVVLDLARKLDAVDTGDGKTLLDHSVVAWSQECGNHTHEAQSIPVIGFGGAEGFLKTGFHTDYRNLATPLDPAEGEKRYVGLLWQQWLGNLLLSMGIPRAEWENAAVNRGYPDYNYAKLNWVQLTAEQAYPSAVWNLAGDLLPWMQA